MRAAPIVREPLNSSPIAPPLVRSKPKGRPVSFEDLLATAGMRNVLTLPRTPEICLHGGAYDFKVPASKGPIYCISGATLPADPHRRAREVMRRLAYGFKDYAAREVVSRFHRDIARSRRMTDPLSDEGREQSKAHLRSPLCAISVFCGREAKRRLAKLHGPQGWLSQTSRAP
jgi:hypothetical protein